MSTWNTVLAAVCWFAAGVVVGAQWTRLRHEVRFIAKAQDREERVTSPEVITEKPSTRRARWWRRALDAFVIMLFLGSAVQAYYTYERIQDVVDCQRVYQIGFADALDARQPVAAAEKEALVKWVTTIDQLITQAQPGVDPATNRQKFAIATREYLQKQADLVKTQNEKPYPPFPRGVCG